MVQDTVTPFHHDGHPVLTLRQLDRLNNVPKGTAFRAFKRARANLVEGRDFFVLDPDRDAGRLAELKAAGLAYDSSHRVVLLTAAAYEVMRGAR